MPDVMGLPLALALTRLLAAGITPEVIYTKAPRHPVEEGETRVLRFSPQTNELLAAVFPPPLSHEGDTCEFSEKPNP